MKYDTNSYPYSFLGGSKNTPAQNAARAKNGRKGRQAQGKERHAMSTPRADTESALLAQQINKGGLVPLSFARTLETELQQAQAALAALQEHEKQTHEKLGAILGTDDSLEECAKRMSAALAAVTLERDEAKHREMDVRQILDTYVGVEDERDKALAQLAACQSREAKALEEIEQLKNTRVPQWVMNGACVENARLRNDLEFAKRQSKMIDAPATCGTCGTRYDAPTTGKLIDECQCGGRLKSAEAALSESLSDRDQLQAQVGAARDFVENVKRRNIAGWAEVHVATDASFRVLAAALAQPAPAAPDSAKDGEKDYWGPQDHP